MSFSAHLKAVPSPNQKLEHIRKGLLPLCSSPTARDLPAVPCDVSSHPTVSPVLPLSALRHPQKLSFQPRQYLWHAPHSLPSFVSFSVLLLHFRKLRTQDDTGHVVLYATENPTEE